MSPKERSLSKAEKTAISASVLAAVGAITVFWARHREKPRETIRKPKEFNPAILNRIEMGEQKLARLNDTMAFLILLGPADRKTIMKRMDITKGIADKSLMYLTDNGLITRQKGHEFYGTKDQYVAVVQWKEELPALLREDPEPGQPSIERKYPYLTQSLDHIISQGFSRNTQE